MNPQEIKGVLDAHEKFIKTVGGEGSRADLIDADLRGADLRGADLRGVYLIDADLRRADLIKHLIAHAQSEHFDQSNWCGTNCCLAGAAGALIDNQSAGVAVIKMTLPEFDINVLYQSDREAAIAELDRVAKIYEVAA